MKSVSSYPMKQREEQLQEQLRILRLEEDDRTVEISNPRTRIQGVLRQSTRFPDLEYIAFLGIPYALSPVEELRFQPPQRLPQLPPDRPTPLYLANNGYHHCTQRFRNMHMGSEDCLYLNVFTPRKPKDIPELLPVLVHIHGGGFTIGDNYDETDPENLLREDLVVVAINYRLGIFGFLNMRTKSCLGNAGMKDQVMALEWIRDNIEQFKGNPKNVTICGQSSGGSCVNLHMLSPLSKGLFHKAIVMAGGVYSPWGYGGHAKYVKQLFKKATGQENESRSVAVEILKRKETFELMKLGEDTMNAYLHPREMGALFKPSVECVREGAFLPDPVEKLMEEAEPVPTLAGISKQEGYTFFGCHETDVIELMKGQIKFVELVKDLIRQNFRWKDPTAVERHFEFFKEKYFPEEWMLKEEGNVKENEENKPTTEEEKQWKEEEQKHCLATLFTDMIFRRFYDNFKIGNLLNEGEPPFYVYEFDYYAGEPLLPKTTLKDDQLLTLIKPRAADHADDYYYLFGPDVIFKSMLNRVAKRDYMRVRSEIERVKTNMSSLWSSFCRTGYPTSRMEDDANVDWKPHTEQKPHYLHIGEELSLVNGRLNEGRWSALNAICQLDPTIPSLAVSPQTPKKQKNTELQQSYNVNLARPQSAAPDTEDEILQLSIPEPDHTTFKTSAEDMECGSTKF